MPIKINGTNTVANPSITGSDTDTGIVYGSDQIDFSTGGTSKVTLNGSNLGIGTSSAGLKLHVQDGALASAPTPNSNCDVVIEGSSSTGIQFLSSDQVQIRFGDAASTAGGSIIYNHTDDYMRFSVGAERMRISSDDIFIGKTTSNFDTAGAHIDDGGQMVNFVKSGTGDFIKLNRSTNVGTFIEFRRGSGNSVGNISSNNTSTSYNTSSDYRLKENVVAISDGITRLKTLKPSRFNFKTEKDTTVDGFLAHEVTAVPEAITGTKDEVDSDNNPIYQGIDQSKLVPLLVAALQEAIGRIEALEAV